MMGSCAAATHELPFFLHADKIVLPGSGNPKFSAIRRKKQKNARLFVKAEAYRRIPMDTPGAYQLVDDLTGDKFIVWGGTDDDAVDGGGDHPSSLPSRQVLSWTPKTTHRSNSLEPQESQSHAPAEGVGIGVTAIESASLRGFDRLRSPKIKALIHKKSSSNNAVAAGNKKMGFDDGASPRKQTKSLSVEAVAAPDYGHVSPPPPPLKAAATALRGWSGAAPVHHHAVVTRPSHHKRMPIDSGFFSRKSFKDLGCADYMVDSLMGLSFTRPSHIQAAAFVPVLRGKSCIIADRSGSGKTLAYLVPIIQCLRHEELQGLGKPSSRCPRVVILVPTAELASQVLNNCRSISKHGVPFRSMVATGGFRQKTQLDNIQQELDVLIATPGRFIYLLQEGFVQLTNLKCVVLDEVDILFGDEGFGQVLQSLINSAPMEAQYLFVTATLPVDIYNKLVQAFPDCEVTMGPGIHRTSSELEEVLVDCSGDGVEKNPETAFLNKKSALLQLVEQSPVTKTIVFCNKIETCRKVENALQRFDRKGMQIKVFPFHAALAQEIRLTNMKEFLNSKSKDSMFLICTDRASRGIDFQDVDHVVLFDFPRDPSEYVRRVGRTARGAGGKGKAFVFVVGKQVPLARRIIERNKKGHPLHDVPSAYELEGYVT